MSNFFTEKYGGATAGRILDTWGQDRINREIGEIYEKIVFGEESIDVSQVLNEYVGRSTGGAVSYGSDLNDAKSRGIIQG